jgi:hypothetical protein
VVGAVSVTTVHKAKGRERQHVFVTGCVDGMVPFNKFDFDTPLTDDELDQERKLFYVALTRAQATLTLTRARRWASNNDTTISPFVEELKKLAKAAGYIRVYACARAALGGSGDGVSESRSTERGGCWQCGRAAPLLPRRTAAGSDAYSASSSVRLRQRQRRCGGAQIGKQ